MSGAVNPDHFVVDTATGRCSNGAPVTSGSPSGRCRRRHQRTETRRRTTGRASPTRSCASWPRSGDRVERHFGAPQDIEWAVDADGVPWLTQTRPITTLYPLPAKRPPRPGRPAGLLLRQPGAGPPPSDHAHGPGRVPADRLLDRAAAGDPVADRLRRTAGFADAGQRLFVDMTAALRIRGRPGADAQGPGRHGGPVRGRSCAACWTTRGSPLTRLPPPAFAAPGAAGRRAVPACRCRSLQAVVSPAAAHRRRRRGSERRSAARSDAGGPGRPTAARRVEGPAQRARLPLLPRIMPGAAAGLRRCWRSRAGCSAPTPPGRAAAVLRGAAPQRHHRDGPGAVAAGRAGAR